MRVLACAVVVACLATACGPKRAPETMKWSQRVLVGALVGVLATSLGAAAQVGVTKDVWLAADVTFGVIGLGSVVVYLAADATDVDEPTNAGQVKQGEAWQLTKTAREAAAKNDCERVRKIDPVVKSLDASFHEVVFLRDVGIQRCLTGR
ncbi:MAG TPA: hypothetical protein VMJ10_07000 [Kofleriaceae bacterium]|nr:hypothetical protein [Kofleriaceae bacterium]